MKPLRTFWSRLRSLWQRREVKREIDEELRFHLEQRTAENIAAGLSPEEAARAARKKFGNTQNIREECRDARGASFGETVWQDLRFGLRMLRKNPGFTVIAVLSLALGIGANTAIFSLLNAVLLRSLPVPEPQTLRMLQWRGNIQPNFASYCRLTNPSAGETAADVFNYSTYCEMRDRSDGLGEVFAFSEFSDFSLLTVLARGQATTANGLMVSGNFFRGLGVAPLLGRTILPDHDRPEAEPVAVISYVAWQKYFAGDPNVLGETVTLNRNKFTIIGVLPKKFSGLVTGYRSDFYIPLASQPRMRPECPLESADHWWIQAMIRLKPGIREQQARAALDVSFVQTARGYGSRENPRFRLLLENGSGGPLMPRQNLAQSLSLLIGLVLMVLLVTCVNLSGLLLARGARRQHELAVRAAMGAAPSRLLRQLTTESILLALLGAGGGLILASWGKSVLARFIWPAQVMIDLQADSRVLGFTLGTAMVVALLFGLIPALLSRRVNPIASLKDKAALGSPRLRLGKAVLSIQVGLSLVLLVGAGLFARSLVNLYRVETGFNIDNVLLFTLDASAAGHQGRQSLDFHEQTRAAIAALPGVQSVAHSNLRLLSGAMNNTPARIPAGKDSPETDIPILGLNVSDSFLSTMGIPLLLGRDFNAGDNETTPKVVMINRAFARKAFPKENPLGKVLIIHSDPCEIVGVFGDIAYATLKKSPEPTVFFPCRQHANQADKVHYEVRTVLDPLALVPAVRKIVAHLNPQIPVSDIKTQAVQLNDSISQERCFALLASGMALLAVLLSCVGLYGLLAYNVARRTGEIGIRMALGATRGRIAWPILKEALLLSGAGVLAGEAGALALTRLIRSRLYEVTPNDPFIFIVAGLMLLAAAALAAWWPARRAAKVDPMEALRCE